MNIWPWSLSRKLKEIRRELNSDRNFGCENYEGILSAFFKRAQEDFEKNKDAINSELQKVPEFVELSKPNYTGSGWVFRKAVLMREVQEKLGLLPDPCPLANKLSDFKQVESRIRKILDD